MRLTVFLVAFMAVGAASSSLAADPAPIDFAHDVLPILKARCAKCHTDGTYKGSFSMDTRESALERIRERTRARDAGWTIATGWNSGRFALEKADFDDMPPVVVAVTVPTRSRS